MIGSMMGAGAAANPYAAAIGAVGAAAAGGPSSAQSGGENSVNFGNVSVGGQNADAPALAGQAFGAPMTLWVAGIVGLVAIVWLKNR